MSRGAGRAGSRAGVGGDGQFEQAARLRGQGWRRNRRIRHDPRDDRHDLGLFTYPHGARARWRREAHLDQGIGFNTLSFLQPHGDGGVGTVDPDVGPKQVLMCHTDAVADLYKEPAGGLAEHPLHLATDDRGGWRRGCGLRMLGGGVRECKREQR